MILLTRERGWVCFVVRIPMLLFVLFHRSSREAEFGGSAGVGEGCARFIHKTRNVRLRESRPENGRPFAAACVTTDKPSQQETFPQRGTKNQ